MRERQRVLLLILIMASVSLTVAAITISMLYRTAFKEAQARLVETAQSQARLIEAMARFDAVYSKGYREGSEQATLSQIIDAHKHYKGFGKTGEFTLARHQGGYIVFLLSHRHFDLKSPKPVPFDSEIAEPMRRALSGLSGTVVGLDYRGEVVLAAHEPVGELNLGIVAKIDLAEIRAPFVRAGLIVGGLAILVVLAGALLFLRISNPMIKRMQGHTAELAKTNEQLHREIDERRRAEEALQRANREIEKRVAERTAELMTASEQLTNEIKERKRAAEEQARLQRRLEALWRIARLIDVDYQTLCDHVLVEIMDMTQSRYAFHGFLNEDESVMSLYSWSMEALADCQIRTKPVEYRISEAGLWGDGVRERKTLIINDYQADHPSKKGLPAGHVPLTRVLVVPIFSHGRVVALAAVANKASDYEEKDARQIEAFVTSVQVILERRKMEESLQQSQKELRLLSSRLLTAEENERKKIAAELHDGIGQSLAAIKFGVENALKPVDKDTTLASVRPLEALIPLIKETVEEVRRIQMDLRPSILDDLGILATLSWFCREFQTIYSGIRIEKQISVEENELPDSLKTVIYRVLQEAMNNIAKHSKTDLVALSLRKTDDSIELVVEDNGRGFDLDKAITVENAPRGLGLATMRERTELSGGAFSIESIKGKGTTIRASWPMRPIA